jgi:hypothetical protein
MNTPFFSQPNDTILHSLEFDGPAELEKKRRTNKLFDKLCQSNRLWNKFLQDEYRLPSDEENYEGLARRIFIKHPSCRAEKYICADEVGKEWLKKILNSIYTNKLNEYGEINNFDDGFVQMLMELEDFIFSGHLTISEAQSVTYEQLEIIEKVKKLIFQGYLTFKQAELLSEDRAEFLNYAYAQGILQANLLPIDQMKLLTDMELMKLMNMKELILAKRIDVLDVPQLTPLETRFLGVCTPLILENIISLEASKKHINNFIVEDIEEEMELWTGISLLGPLIKNEIITLEDAKQLNEIQLKNLASATYLISKNIISFDEIFKAEFTEKQRHNLSALNDLASKNNISINKEDVLLALGKFNPRDLLDDEVHLNRTKS